MIKHVGSSDISVQYFLNIVMLERSYELFIDVLILIL